MGFVIGFVVVAAVILMGGGNTLKGLGSDMKTTGSAMEQTFNGREAEPSGYNRPQTQNTATVPQLPAREEAAPVVPPAEAQQQTIPAVQGEDIQ